VEHGYGVGSAADGGEDFVAGVNGDCLQKIVDG
jgi:hypothetical protein